MNVLLISFCFYSNSLIRNFPRDDKFFIGEHGSDNQPGSLDKKLTLFIGFWIIEENKLRGQ